MQVLLTGRRTSVDDSLRAYVADRLARLDKLDPKVERVEVEVCEEANPRLADRRVRVELTWYGRGPVVRSEAAAAEPHAAADLALGRLDRRLRKAADRRRIHRGSRTPVSVAAATASATVAAVPSPNGSEPVGDDTAEQDSGPMVVREKEHVAAP